MNIRLLGAGWYSCHVALALLRGGHSVDVFDIAPDIFTGASGSNPARCHNGQHYPRSRLTRAACQENSSEFMRHYGDLTAGVPVNIYAIAEHDSLMDFGTYTQVLRGEIEFITIAKPSEFGLANVEGGILTGERHVVIRKAKEFFRKELDGHLFCNAEKVEYLDDPRWDFTVDATFCSYDAEAIDRFEPCMMVILEGPCDRAITIMDGQFGSIYPWDEEHGLSSLTSAKYTPFSKTCRTWRDAKAILDGLSEADIEARTEQMVAQMSHYYQQTRDLYRVVGHKFSIRALPKSAADMRIVDVIMVGERAARIRAGKIDAVFAAQRQIETLIGVQ